VVILASGLGYLILRPRNQVAPRATLCVADPAGQDVEPQELTTGQAAIAATIAGVASRRDLPARAVAIAYATALQESKLANLHYGDLDSVGVFQQRPSQGWGTVSQISNPRYAAGRFYSALLTVRGWQQMSVTQAAQAVQRSGAPTAYQTWAADATILAHALAGDQTAAISCSVAQDPVGRGTVAMRALSTHVHLDWGDEVGKASAASPGTFVLTAASKRTGWQYAHWLVAHAQDSGVSSVTFAGLRWTAKDGVWAASPPASASPTTDAAAAADIPTTAVIAQVFG
jgi:hypothetical protein